MLYGHPQGNVFYRLLHHQRPMIQRGEGVYLFDDQGKSYLDGSGGPFVVNVGHGRKEVSEAIAAQMNEVSYVHAKMFTSKPVELYSQTLAPHLPFNDPRLFYLSSGTEAVEAAMKLARQIQQSRGEHQRTTIISRSMSYHGMTFGALSATGRSALRKDYEAMINEGVHVTTPYAYRDKRGGQALADELRETILRVGPKNVAAFLAEPISGASLGAALPDDEYWPAIRKVCDEFGVLLIADEVLVGLGRTGAMWALDHFEVRPDILVCAKGCAGGYFPFSFLACERRAVDSISSALGAYNHGGTFSHHALGAAAALAVLKIILAEDLVERSRVQGALMFRLLRERLKDCPQVGDIRGRGLLAGVELVQDRASKLCFERNMAAAVQAEAASRGLICYYAHGFFEGRGDVVMLGPPLTISDAEVAEMVALLGDAIEACV